MNPPLEQDVARELDLMETYRTRLVPFVSEDYPAALRHLDRYAPVLLRLRGDYRSTDELALAVVGTRRCTP